MDKVQRDKEMHENFMWFLENYKALYLLNGRGYLVIVDKGCVGKFSTTREALDFVNKRGYEVYNIQYCDGTPDAYTAKIYCQSHVSSDGGVASGNLAGLCS